MADERKKPEKLSATFQAQREVFEAAQVCRQIAAAPKSADFLRQRLPRAGRLQAVFGQLEPNDRQPSGPVVRATLYGVVRAGFASKALSPRLRSIKNLQDEAIGEMLFDWMQGRLDYYRIPLALLHVLDPAQAVDRCTVAIRYFLSGSGIVICDPENTEVHACRNPYPDDFDYVTTITVAGDFPRTVTELARVYDPRSWDGNPYSVHFDDVHAVSDVNGTPTTRLEQLGETWIEPAFISEEVSGQGGVSLTNTLSIDFVVRPDWMRFVYFLGKTIQSSSTIALERDFGYLDAESIPGRPGWSHVALEKNVRFSSSAGSSGIDIGWGDLANLIAPDLIAEWLSDMRYMPCWTPP